MVNILFNYLSYTNRINFWHAILFFYICKNLMDIICNHRALEL